MSEEEWTNGLVKALTVALADAGGEGALILANASEVVVDFVLPESGSDRPWRLRLDSGTGAIDEDDARHSAGEGVTVPGRCLLLYSLWSRRKSGANLPMREPTGAEDG
jgi:hypothetical protein